MGLLRDIWDLVVGGVMVDAVVSGSTAKTITDVELRNLKQADVGKAKNRITLVTGNSEKQKEFASILTDTEIQIAALELHEIQSFDLHEVVEHKVRAAFEQEHGPVIVEDVSFEITALNGFPGPFVKWWAKVVGYETALIVCDAKSDRTARALCAAAYFDGERLIVGESDVKGRLTERAGDDGFGFDFYFIPDDYDKTYAQLGHEVKNRTSHRARCLRDLQQKLSQQGVF